MKLPSQDAGSRQLGVAIAPGRGGGPLLSGDRASIGYRRSQAVLGVVRAGNRSGHPGARRPIAGMAGRRRGGRWDRRSDRGGAGSDCPAARRSLGFHEPAPIGLAGPPPRTQLLFDGVPAALPAFRERFADRLEPHQLAAVERLDPRGRSTRRGPGGDRRSSRTAISGSITSCSAVRRWALRAKVIDWQSVRLAPPANRRRHLAVQLPAPDRPTVQPG